MHSAQQYKRKLKEIYKNALTNQKGGGIIISSKENRKNKFKELIKKSFN